MRIMPVQLLAGQMPGVEQLTLLETGRCLKKQGRSGPEKGNKKFENS